MQPPVAGFPAYGGGQLTAYQLLSQYLLAQPVANAPWPPAATAPSAAYQDVRAQYANLQLQGQWLTFYQAVAALQGRPPAGVAGADFETVRAQLQTELLYVQYTTLWFANLRAFLTELFDEDQMSVGLVADYLALPATSTENVVLEALSLAAAFVGGIISVVATGGSAVAGVAAALAGLVSTAFSTAAAASGDGTGVQVQVAQLQAQLLQTREDALRGNDLAQAAFLAHWPLLHALGQPISTLQVTWPRGQVDVLAAGARRGYETSLWQTLAPVIWSVQSNLLGDSGFGGYPPRYVYHWQPPADGWWVGGCGAETDSAWLAQGNAIPNQAGLSRLFDQPAPGDLAGPLGASMYDVMNGYGGWTFPASLNNDCGPQAPPIDPVGLRRPHPNPLPVPS